MVGGSNERMHKRTNKIGLHIVVGCSQFECIRTFERVHRVVTVQESNQNRFLPPSLSLSLLMLFSLVLGRVKCPKTVVPSHLKLFFFHIPSLVALRRFRTQQTLSIRTDFECSCIATDRTASHLLLLPLWLAGFS